MKTERTDSILRTLLTKCDLHSTWQRVQRELQPSQKGNGQENDDWDYSGIFDGAMIGI